MSADFLALSPGKDIPAATAKVVSIIGGTGKEGRGLALRLARAGYRIIIGSRTLEKAMSTAQEITNLLDGRISLVGMHNLDAIQQSDLIILTVPYSAHRETLESIRVDLQGKILIDVTVPLAPPQVTKVNMPAAGSATQEARSILGEGVEVCAAFQNIAFEQLTRMENSDCDVLVTGTSKAARQVALQLVADAGFTGWDAGPIENSMVLEGLTSILIYINKQYGSSRAGIKITGVNQG